MVEEEIDAGSASRLFKLGSLAMRVGASVAGNATANLLRSADARRAGLNRNQIRNALRVVDTLGRMKGVPMKIGQMLSLYDGMLPREVAEVLRSLQRNAPPVAFERLRAVIDSEIGKAVADLVWIDPEPWAAASIGQLHRARHRDGTELILKIQYPGIDDVIRADLRNLRGVMNLLLGFFTSMDTRPLWSEVEERLLEELDYLREADNLRRMSQLYSETDIVLPQVYEQYSAMHVLCMSFEPSLTPDEACDPGIGQDLRDRWGQALFVLVVRGLLENHFLHADPNLSNFGFRENGSLVVYDCGCMKEVPSILAQGYAQLASSVMVWDLERAQSVLRRVGISLATGEPVPLAMISDFASVLRQPFASPGRYSYGDARGMYREVRSAVLDNWETAMKIHFPRDVLFIDRTLSGHFGNLVRLRAAADWHSMLKAQLAAVGEPVNS